MTLFDRLNFRRRTPPPTPRPAESVDGLPDVAFPPLWDVADSIETATRWASRSVTVGIGAEGNCVEHDLSRGGHLITGASGSGTSVLKHGIVEQLRARGFEILIADGFGSDFLSTSKAANVTALGCGHRGGRSALVPIVMAWREMRARMSDPDRRRSPLLLVVSDIDPPSFAYDYGSSTSKSKNIGVDLVSDLLRWGPECGCHVLINAYSLRPPWIETWMKSVRYVSVLGSNAWLPKGLLPADMHAAVRQTSSRLNGRIRGRGLLVDTRSGSVDAFQAYFPSGPEYSAYVGSRFAEHQDRVEEFAQRVTAQIPVLYPRRWLAITGPSREQVRRRAAGQQFDHVELPYFTERELTELETVDLETVENGSAVPIASAAQFDPTSDSYVARDPRAGLSPARQP